MNHYRHFVVRLVGLFVVTLGVGCTSDSIDDRCRTSAEAHCANCYACGDDGADACGVSADLDEAGCVEEVFVRCGDQAATVEEAKAELELCEDSLPELSCELVSRSIAQGGLATTEECQYFL